MDNLKNNIALCAVFSIIIAQKIIAGDVIIVNRCHESLGIVHVKDIKGKKKYNSKPEELKIFDRTITVEAEKSVTQSKKPKIKKDREIGLEKSEKLEHDELFKGSLKPGEYCIVRGIDFENNEKIYAKGYSWRRIRGTKAHYTSLHLKTGDYLVFIDKSEAGFVFGGKLVKTDIKIDNGKEELIKKLNYIYSDIIPLVKEIDFLNDKDLKDRGIGALEKDLDKIGLFIRTLSKYDILKNNYAKLINSLSCLDIKIRVVSGKAKPEAIYEKKIKNLSQEELFSCSAIIKGLVERNKEDNLDKLFAAYNAKKIKKIVLVANHMGAKGEIKDNTALSEIVAKGRWKIGVLKANKK